MKEDVTLYPVRVRYGSGISLINFSHGVNPIDVSLFRSNAVMLHPEDLAHLIEQFGHVRDLPPNPGLFRGSADEYMFARINHNGEIQHSFDPSTRPWV